MKYYFWLSSFTHFFVAYYVFLNIETFEDLITAFVLSLLSMLVHVFLACICNLDNYFNCDLTEYGKRTIFDDNCQYSWFYFIVIPLYFYIATSLFMLDAPSFAKIFLTIIIVLVVIAIETFLKGTFDSKYSPFWAK